MNISISYATDCRFKAPLVSFCFIFVAFVQLPSALAQDARSAYLIEESGAQFGQETQRMKQGLKPQQLGSLVIAKEDLEAPVAPEIAAESAPVSNSTYPWTAEDIAQAAYEGHLQDEGIPGYQTLASECRGGFTNARDVLRAAVKAGMLPSRVMDDGGYLEQLRRSLAETLGVPVD